MSTKSQAKASAPSFKFESELSGPVCGLDEVGRAPLAGPVVAACVYIPESKRRKRVWSKVNDSKLLSRAQREALYGEIAEYSYFAIGEACPREVEQVNIVQASFKAMQRAYLKMTETAGIHIQNALIDGNSVPPFPCSAHPIIKGDRISCSIAAASIMAKVTRDRYMMRLAEEFPHYGWESNVGYGTKAHLQGIEKYGITPHHRTSFAAVRNFIESGSVDRQIKLAI